MKLRILAMVSLAVLALCPVNETFARGIRADFGSTSPDCNLGGSSPLTQVSPIDSFGNNINPNVGIPITAECNSTSGADQVFGPMMSGDNPYSNANMYLWGVPMSSPGVLAQVMDYSLTSGDMSANGQAIGGFNEIEFNYTTCTSSLAVFKLGAATYSTPCSNTNSYSLLFNGNSLVGYLDNNNDETAGLPTGWTKSTSASVPEPDSLALLGGLAVPVLFLSRLLRRRTNPQVI